MAELSSEHIILANKIAQRIRDLRIQKCGDKQKDFIEKYNVEKQVISRWEAQIKIDPKTGDRIGKNRGVTIYTVEKFCNLIGITLSEFFNDSLFR